MRCCHGNGLSPKIDNQKISLILRVPITFLTNSRSTGRVFVNTLGSHLNLRSSGFWFGRERKGLWKENTSCYARERLILTVFTPKGELQAYPQTVLLVTSFMTKCCFCHQSTTEAILLVNKLVHSTKTT